MLEIVTPDKMVLKEEVEYVGAPGINGEFGVLPNHIPFLSALGIGGLYYKLNDKKYYVFVAGGFAEVTPTKVTILAEVAERAEDIDLERARRAQERAEQRSK
jgi:F-type H+-transporting ATPase subunit epsilon